MKYRKPYRIKKKKSLLKNRYFRRVVLFSILLGEIFYTVYFSPFFQIKEIKVTGNEKVRSEAIKIFVPLGSIFLVDSEKITKNILSSFSQIAEVKIDRKFPDKLNLTIRERGATAVFCQNDQCFLIDEEGIIFESVSVRLSLTEIRVEDGPLPNSGDRVLEKKTVAALLAIESALKDLKISIKEILVASDDRLNAKTLENWQIYFDPQRDINWQITKLKALLENEIPENRRKNLEYIDLRFGNLAPYKYR